ncbi:AsmA-like C-terminal region-containing protein [Jannaschia rubra]|uniref:Uncharacterized protein n=1 Tax=Jannaschia rubra TaxID=282197 RepID=A0A0M6XS10_9RHOB|nr:AsmA-like C-terminal region-containing protein [Jannaschia rubra]CTQ33946.1 putative protein involved in outer membrane biogenesis [Jannaschia rubra]SFG76734.1 AsmA-like C-terminal region [Jannaschia rubra]
MPERPAAQPRRRGRRRASALVLLVLCALLAGAVLRLTQGPVALPAWTVARIEQRIGRDLAPRQVSLGLVALFYDLEDQALRLRLRDARLTDASGPVVTLPDARVALDGAALLRGKLRPRRVAVEGLSLDVARDADGAFSLAFGAGGGDLPGTWSEALETLDTLLANPVIAELSDVTVEGVTLRFTDAITGLSETVEDGTVVWARDGGGVRLSLTSSLRLGARTARVAMSLTRRGDGQGAQATVALDDLSLAGLAEAVPGVPALTLVKGEVSASAAMTLAEDGTPGPLVGRLEAGGLSMTDRPALALDRALLAFAWQPGPGRIALSQIEASSDDLSLTADGQILLEDGLIGPVQMQLRLGPTVLDPEGLFDRRVEFAQGLIEARLTQAPLGLAIGQAMLTGPSGTARLSGRLTFTDEGPAGALRLVVPQMAVDQLVALWPPSIQPQGRAWFTTNLLGGEARRAVALVRLEPATPPQVAASFEFSGGAFRYMREMPPAQDAAGAAQLDGNRLTLRLDRGAVPVTGPDQPEPSGTVDVAGTTFTIPDATARPAEGVLDLTAQGGIGDILTLMDNPPFRLLDRLNKTRDLASGAAEARVAVRLPLRKGNAPADIAYDVTARLTDVESRAIVPGRLLAAPDLTLTAAPGEVTIAGDMTLEGVPFSGRWRQALPPPLSDPIVPGAPPPPPRPLPEPGQVTGTARLTPDGLERLGITIDALDLRGEASADLSIVLPQGEPPRLSVRSDLRGLSVALPVINWSKGAARAADLLVEATLGPVPEVTRVALDAPGLDATGQVTLRAEGGLDRASFDRVDAGWFDGPLVLAGRGRGVAPAVTIRGGTADLRRALLNTGGEGGGDGAPLDIALARLQVTEGIALTDLRATLRGGAGSFTGRINGGAAVEGAIAPQGGGTAVQIRGGNAGEVLRSAGLFRDAAGGPITLTLRPTGQTGVFSGSVRMADVRVRNAPALASLLQALSVVGILEQLGGEGLFFPTVESEFVLRPGDIIVRQASAVGPSMSITADGTFDLGSKRMDMQGVISPIYLVNGLFGALFARRDEGLFGFTYRLSGPVASPAVSVNPLSILTPGVFRDIFRKDVPS